MKHDHWRIARLSLRTLAYAAVIAAAVWLFASRAGLAWAWHMARPLLPHDLQVASVSGRVIGPITVKGVHYKSAGLEVSLQRAVLDWKPSRLLLADVDIVDLRLHGLHVRKLAGAAKAGGGPSRRPAGRLRLPVFLHLHRLRITDFSYQPSSKARAWHFSSLSLGARYDQHGASIHDLKLQGQRVTASGHLSIASRGDRAIAGHLRWRLHLPGYAPIPGDTRLSGTLDRLVVHQQVGAPYNLDARVTLADALIDLHWQARLKVARMHLARVSQRLQPATLSASAQGSGGRSSADTRLDLSVDSKRFGKARLSATARYRSGHIALSRAVLTVPGQPTSMHLDGGLSLGRPLRVSAHASWRHLRWPLSGAARFTSPRGRLNASGTLDDLVAGIEARVGAQGRVNATLRRHGQALQAFLSWSGLGYPDSRPRWRSPTGYARVSGTIRQYALQAGADFDLQGKTGGHLTLTGDGTRQAFHIKKLALAALGGSIDGSGRVAWKPALKATLDLKGHGLDPGKFEPRWPGRLAVVVKADAGLAKGQVSANVQQLKVNGRLRGKPFDLAARGQLRNRQLSLSLLHLVSGSNRLEAHGDVGTRRVDLSWSIDARHLGQLLPSAGGSVRGKGHLQGSLKRPRADLRLRAAHLHYRADSLSSLSLSGNVDLTGSRSSHLTASLAGASVAGQHIRSAHVTVSGRPANHAVSLSVDSARGSLSVRLHGNADSDWTRWQGAITRATLKPARLAAWHLGAPARVSVDKGVTTLQPLCWVSGHARLCLHGQRSRKGMSGAFRLSGLEMSYVHRLLPSAVAVRGSLDASGHVQAASGKAPRGQLQVSLDNGELVEPAADGKQRVIRLQRTTARLQLDTHGAHLTAHLGLAQGGADVDLRLAPGQRALARRRMTGRARFNLDSLRFLNPFVPRISHLNGRVQGDMTLGGSLKRPRIDGQLVLDQGQLRVVPAGIDVKGVHAVLKSRGYHLSVSASAESGGGKLHIDASGDLGGGQRFTAKVDGKDFQVMNTAIARVALSPALDITAHGRDVRVTGQVVVPKASITPSQLPQGSDAVTVSSDQVIVHSGGSKTRSPWRVSASVRVVLGNQVSFSGFGLKAQLGGSLLTQVEPGKPPSGSGQLVIRSGHYKAYGQDLTIKDGRILFGGPLDKPGVDVRATRKPQPGITVGVHVKGPLKDPQFTLFSDPDMSQNNQLSWLVLGHSVSSSSGQGSAALAQAALALGIKGSNYLTSGLGKELGLSSLSIQSGAPVESRAPVGSANPYARNQAAGSPTGQQASLMIGKYLSPRLYVSYGMGLLQQAYVLKLKYILSSKFTLQTEASTLASGVDLIYSIERGNP